MSWSRRLGRRALPGAPNAPQRLDIPIYLDAGVALSLSASLGLAMESSIEAAIASDSKSGVGARAGVGPVLSTDVHLGSSQSVAVTASEVRKHTQASIFNAVRSSLEQTKLLKQPTSPWGASEWRVGDFVDCRSGRIIVPLVSALSRVRVIAEAFAYATGVLTAEVLQQRVPQILHQIRNATGEIEPTELEESASLDAVLAIVTETGEVAGALAGLIKRLEEEAQASGLVDVVLLESKRDERDAPQIIAVASLDREYVDTKLLRRLGQSDLSILGKVVRAPEPGTAFNAFRNSMLGATNQFPVLLTRFTSRLAELPLLLGDGVRVGEDDGSVYLDIVGSASAITELNPLWVCPSVEIFPIAIYA